MYFSLHCGVFNTGTMGPGPGALSWIMHPSSTGDPPLTPAGPGGLTGLRHARLLVGRTRWGPHDNGVRGTRSSAAGRLGHTFVAQWVQVNDAGLGDAVKLADGQSSTYTASLCLPACRTPPLMFSPPQVTPAQKY